MRVEKFTNAAQLIEAKQTQEEIWQEFERFLSGFGVDFYIYITVDQQKQNPIIFTNTGIHQEAATQVFDPFLDYCCNSYNITKTGAEFLNDYPYLDEMSRNFILEAAKSGFISGLGIPVRLAGATRYGGFNLGTRHERSVFEELIAPLAESLRLLCLIVHRKIEELQLTDLASSEQETRLPLITPPIAKLEVLSEREREVLFLVSKGMTRRQCAEMCSVTEHTVSTHLKKAYAKLGVNNKAEATRLIVEAEEDGMRFHPDE